MVPFFDFFKLRNLFCYGFLTDFFFHLTATKKLVYSRYLLY